MAPTDKRRSFAFLPVTVHLETLGGLATPLVLRGTPLPADRVETFSTAADDQDTVEVKVLMGESRLAATNYLVGTFKLTGIPPQPRGVPQIQVRFRVDRTCVISAAAEITGTDFRAEQTFEPPQDMSDEAVARMVAGPSGRENEDAIVGKIEAANRAQSLIAIADARLRQSTDAGLSRAVAELGLALQDDDSEVIRTKSDQLQRLLAPPPDLDFLGQFFGQRQSRPMTKPPAVRKPASTARETTVAAKKANTTVLGKLFGGGQFALDPKLCFVLMPFGAKFQAIYDDHLRPTIESAGLRCQRADEVMGVTNITWDIWERISSARFLVADLTDRNANVFYEVGLGHALSKDVILITQSMQFVPFDLQAVRCIEYEYTPRGMRTFEGKLRTTIDEVMRSD